MKQTYCVALIHYHLNGGGVTRIVEQQSLALTELGIPHVVFCGENKLQLPLPHHVIPDLQFSNLYSASISEKIAEEITSHCIGLFGDRKIIFHFHNHSIGLNPHYEDIVHSLAHKFSTLLQIHDFVEDGRDANRLNIRNWKKLYPNGEHIHYVCINSRDQNILKNAGAKNCEILPNCYRSIAKPTTRENSTKSIFYPVQALRRKNLGEILLLSMLSPKGYSYHIGQTPSLGRDIAKYWQKLSEELKLPVQFDVADKVTPPFSNDPRFSSWYDHCSHVVTTSIQEGFGMAFIEPLHFGKPLIGRDLPEISNDIKEAGVNHQHLYNTISIGSELLVEAGISACDSKDFGTLNEGEQATILRTLARTPHLSRLCLADEKTLEAYLIGALNENSPLPASLLEPWSFNKLKSNLVKKYDTLAKVEISPTAPLDHSYINKIFSDMPRLGLKHQAPRI